MKRLTRAAAIIAGFTIGFFIYKYMMENKPYIKIIRGEKEYCYTKKDWDFAWFLTWIFGVLVGAMAVLIINSLI